MFDSSWCYFTLKEQTNQENSLMMHHLVATLTTPPKSARIDYSGRLTERKRALFPSQTQDSDDSDIGHMSPIEYSSSPESSPQNETNTQIHDSEESCDYFMGAHNQENINPQITKKQKNVSFEHDIPPKSPEISDTIIPGTPAMSPTEILKTPHDSNQTNQKVPRLVRKSLIDITNIDATSLKRKSESPIESPANKTLKFEHQAKTSKARTALFPESMFPAKSFYPKTEQKTTPIYFIDLTQKVKKKCAKKSPVYLCNRSRNQQIKKNFGLINAGVRHKIKKPRLKPALSKTQLLKAALNIVKNSPLNEYFDDLSKQSICSENECGVSFEQIQKMDSILKNLQVPPIEEDVKPNLVKKRSLSPQPDHTKKFFKSGHVNKATVTITNNIKLNVEHGEMSLIEKKIRRPKREIIEYDPLEFSFNEETPKICDTSFSDIIQTLDTEENIPESTTPPLQVPLLAARSSVIKSEINVNNSMLLSPTSLVCDLTSGLALDSPKNQPTTSLTLNKLSALKKRISFPENMDNSNQKLFPIFYGKQNDPKPVVKENKHVRNIRKIWKPLSQDQTLIDAGQKKFGLTECAECKCVYSVGEPEDEIMHYQHHNSVSVLRYNCWKHERVVNHFSNGKVLQINPNDPKTWIKKVKDLLEVINRELGFVDVPFNMTNQKVFLCVMNKQIVGCLVAEPKMHAHKMLHNRENIDQCTEQVFPVKCGVSRLWVAAPQRNKGIGTCLMNAMRSNFMYGHILSTHEIAFSAPTEAGKKFASKYMKTEEFYIYTS